MSEADLPRIAVLASGGGETLQALIDAERIGTLRANVVLLISNRSRAGAAQRAVSHGIPFVHLSSANTDNEAALDEQMLTVLTRAATQCVVLAGYLKKLGPQTLDAFAGRIINTHPSLLPRFGGAGMYGSRVHDAVIRSGATLSGASIHYVTQDYDEGPVIAQQELDVRRGETAAQLEARVKAVEQDLLVHTLNALLRAPPPDLQRLRAPPGYRIQLAGPRHLAALPGIENAAGVLFDDIGIDSDLDVGLPMHVFEAAQSTRLLWVALSIDDEPVGFALCERHGAFLHLQEMDVLPAHGRRGLGAALLHNVLEHARCQGCPAVTLTTYRELPWNEPFYRRHRFIEIAATQMPAHVSDRLALERRHGIPGERRIALWCETGAR